MSKFTVTRPSELIFEVTVPRRTPNDWADIVVYADDDALTNLYIVVECKKPIVTGTENKQPIEQGFGNANLTKAAFLRVVTSKTLNNYYDVAN